jgi:hypothetical protein
MARDRQARLPGQHPVQQHQIGQGLTYDSECLLRIRGPQNVVAGTFEVNGNQLLNGSFVFYD